MNFRGCQIRARYCIVEVEVGFELLLKAWLQPLWTLTCVTRDGSLCLDNMWLKDAAQSSARVLKGDWRSGIRRVYFGLVCERFWYVVEG